MVVFKLNFPCKSIKMFAVNLWKRFSVRSKKDILSVVIETNNTKGGAAQYFYAVCKIQPPKWHEGLVRFWHNFKWWRFHVILTYTTILDFINVTVVVLWFKTSNRPYTLPLTNFVNGIRRKLHYHLVVYESWENTYKDAWYLGNC